MKKIIVAPDSFKGAVSSKKACDIMAEALEKCGCFEVVKMPLADGSKARSISYLLLTEARSKPLKYSTPSAER